MCVQCSKCNAQFLCVYNPHTKLISYNHSRNCPHDFHFVANCVRCEGWNHLKHSKLPQSTLKTPCNTSNCPQNPLKTCQYSNTPPHHTQGTSNTHDIYPKHPYNTPKHPATHLKRPKYVPNPTLCIIKNVRIKRDTHLNFTIWLLLLFRLYFSFLLRPPSLFLLLLPSVASVLTSEPRNTSKHKILDKILRRRRVT